MDSKCKAKDQEDAREDRDPCYVERQASMKCLDDNDYEKTKCSKFFENMRACKTFWFDVRMARMRAGVWPHDPLPEERNGLRRKYARTRVIPVTADEEDAK